MKHKYHIDATAWVLYKGLMAALVYRTVKTLANKDCRKFGGKIFGELKSICIGNVIEIVKICKKLGKML